MPTLLAVGSYADAAARGIHLLRLDPDAPALTPVGGIAGIANPSFLAVRGDGRVLAAVSETWGAADGMVVTYAVDGERLVELGRIACGGRGPCHASFDAAGRTLAVANYGDGSAALIALRADGAPERLAARARHAGRGADAKRQEGPHAHWAGFSPDGRRVHVVDLGIDRVRAYGLAPAIGSGPAPDWQGEDAIVSTPGAGPRHLAWHPRGDIAYVVNELACTLTAYAYDAESGAFTERATVKTMPRPVGPDDTTAAIVIAPDGRSVYVSNRGHDSVAVFRLAADGTPQAPSHVPCDGRTPRDLALDPSGTCLLVANQGSDAVSILHRDPATGDLRPSGVRTAIPKPTCVIALAPR